MIAKCAAAPLGLILGCFLAACQHQSESETRPPGENVLAAELMAEAMSGPVDFARHIKPIIVEKCLYCHNPKDMAARYNVSDAKSAFAMGAEGPRIRPGQPSESPFVKVLKGSHALEMPAVGNKVTGDEIRLLEKWIKEGAAWPKDATGTLWP